MLLNDLQAPDALDIEQLIAKVLKAVRYACRFYGYQANQDEVEDLSQDILVKLIKNGGRVMQSFANRSLIDTWLYTVVRHELRPYFLGQRWEKENLSNVDDLSPETLRYEANQEKRLIDEEERKTLRAVISRLPDRKRRLIELDLQDLKSGEIAKEMGIKIESVYHQKSVLLKEIQRLIEGGGGAFRTSGVTNFREIFSDGIKIFRLAHSKHGRGVIQERFGIAQILGFGPRKCHDSFEFVFGRPSANVALTDGNPRIIKKSANSTANCVFSSCNKKNRWRYKSLERNV